MTSPSELPPPPPPPRWATAIAGRRPEFKMHTTWGHVRAAVGGSFMGVRGGVRGGNVYEWNGTEWVLLYDIPPGTPKKDNPFFLGTKGGPQDVEKMKRREEAARKARIDPLRQELEELEGDK